MDYKNEQIYSINFRIVNIKDKNGNFLEVFNEKDLAIRKDNLHINIKELDKIKYFIKKNLNLIKSKLLPKT